jgi:hypothetical protein
MQRETHGSAPAWQATNVRLTRIVPSALAITDERTAKRHPLATRHTFPFNPLEAIFLSFAGEPPKAD